MSTIESKNVTTRARLLSLVYPHWKTFFVAMIALGLGSGINLLLPEVLRQLLKPEHQALFVERPLLVGSGILFLFAIQGLAFYYRAYLFGAIGQKVVSQLRKSLYSSLVRREVAFFDRERVGDLVSRLGSDTLMVQDAVSLKLSVFIRYSFQVVVGIAMMSYLSFTLTLTILLILPLLVLLAIFLGKKLRALSKLQQGELAKATIIAEETLSGARIVKAFNREGFEESRYQDANSKILLAGLKRTGISAFFSSFVSFLMNVAIVVVILFGLVLVGHGSMTIGDLTAFLLYGVIVAVSFAFVASGYGEFLQAEGAAERVFELLDAEPERDIPSSEVHRGLLAHNSIHFDSVTFSYPTRIDTPVLKEISLSLEQGYRTALVGPSGSGKSTIVNLLLGFYASHSGAIRVGSQLLSTISKHDLRAQIGVVTQDPLLFAVSIEENLRYGKETATQQELEEVCRKVNMLDFIQGLPEGFKTNVGERGVQMSGGQKQRLTIARAMLKDPALLILDEATSSLDSENEALIQSSLETLMKGRTALIIAHRLSTVKDAQRVYVLDHGKIVQTGTHDTLSSQPGIYQQLVLRQELK